MAMDNLLSAKCKTGGNRYVVIQKEAENTTGEARKQPISVKEKYL